MISHHPCKKDENIKTKNKFVACKNKAHNITIDNNLKYIEKHFPEKMVGKTLCKVITNKKFLFLKNLKRVIAQL